MNLTIEHQLKLDLIYGRITPKVLKFTYRGSFGSELANYVEISHIWYEYSDYSAKVEFGGHIKTGGAIQEIREAHIMTDAGTVIRAINLYLTEDADLSVPLELKFA